MSTDVGFESNKDLNEIVGDVDESIEKSLDSLEGTSVSCKPTLEGTLIMVVTRLILHGYKHIEIITYLKNKYPSIRDTDQRSLLRDAESKISTMFDADQHKMYNMVVSRYDHIYYMAMKLNDLKTAVGAMDRIVKLFNLDEFAANKFRGAEGRSHYESILDYINNDG